MKKEKLRVTWKIKRKKGHGRNINSYCSYIVENENHKHKLKTKKGTKLFNILSNTIIYKKSGTKNEVFVDGIYDNNGNLLFVLNFRKINNIHFYDFDIKNTVKKYKRNCPTCNKELFYKYNFNRNRANRKNSICRSCSNKKRERVKHS